MPVCVKKIKNKYRIIEFDSNAIAKNKSGTALDCGGHDSIQAALKQMRAVNASLESEGKI